jgi:hypothetical protein
VVRSSAASDVYKRQVYSGPFHPVNQEHPANQE